MGVPQGRKAIKAAWGQLDSLVFKARVPYQQSGTCHLDSSLQGLKVLKVTKVPLARVATLVPKAQQEHEVYKATQVLCSLQSDTIHVVLAPTFVTDLRVYTVNTNAPDALGEVGAQGQQGLQGHGW
jgi:transposase-like protein